jgi:adenylate cyclase, class 2
MIYASVFHAFLLCRAAAPPDQEPIMKRVNFEFKARMRDERRVRRALKQLRARYVGLDHQVDTYFHAPAGRLKVREGKIENALIFYRRSNSARPRRSSVDLMLLPRRSALRAILSRVLTPRVVVDKKREIYFVGNVKIHLDRVRGLGKFLEVEAITRTGRLDRARGQALRFQKLFGVSRQDIVAKSYSDMVKPKSRR